MCCKPEYSSLFFIYKSTYLYLTVVDVGFRFNSYSTSEPEAVIEVCVAVVTGHLGTDIRLQLVTHSGTAIGETKSLCDACTYVHVLSSILYFLQVE